MTTKEIIYVGDPMCSWCWGFSHAVEEIYTHFNDQAPLTIRLGGLHAYETDPMSDDYKATIRHHWEDVNRATGAPFDFSFFDREGFVLDTEPACRAVVTMRSLHKEKTLPFYEAISRSFYTENKDTTDVETFKVLCEEVGADPEEFEAKFSSDDYKELTKLDFIFCQRTGATGFPSMMVKEGETYAMLTAGYQPFENLKPILERWIEVGLAGFSQDAGHA
ncbi:MAG: DsbA family protein [Rhodospirillales bacterium]|jgi:putative protein-disulfide isomerase|nr:DsbA family protein [Rhodospirillales bacterium]MBT3905860.1 DsbA family protein [Rhodospirillaceae bacterium]MBT5035110.1 DsbA family protein [Rhodospirillaceae bacterium]MBT6221118.1 DsbA family protein [Rhodospirillaceae bacterium]MBT6360923.1 DsbA family protein [Rhodospirillaceae bacterium]